MNYLRFFLAATITFGLYACQDEQRTLDDVLNANYEEHFISSGNNFPQISLKENNRYKFLVGLHNGFSADEIAKVLDWNNEQLKSELTLLEINGYLNKKANRWFPSISIIMQDEGDLLFRQTSRVVYDIVPAIVQLIPKVEEQFGSMSVAEDYSFDDFSFFLLSDVLLDNWQINYVEDHFLQKERPMRHGKRYYIQYAELDPNDKTEVFGIYGNQYKCQSEYCYITYGNNRKNEYRSIEEMDKMKIPVLTKIDQMILDDIAELFSRELVEILNDHRSYFERNYKTSIASDEISFEEYFIWYYHFLYTAVTNKLQDKGYLSIPESGNFRVKLKK